LRRPRVLEQRARRADRRAEAFGSEPGQVPCLEVAQQRAQSRITVELPGGQPPHRGGGGLEGRILEIVGGEDLGGLQALQLGRKVTGVGLLDHEAPAGQ
jgi:hypothetical protein